MAKTAKAPKPQKQEPLEKQLWKAADKLRKNIDAAEYKHIVLGLIFLKYISDAFEELRQKLLKGEGTTPGQTRRTATNTRPKMSSLYRLQRGGVTSCPGLSSRKSERSLLGTQILCQCCGFG
jgi:hypothetical protein